MAQKLRDGLDGTTPQINSLQVADSDQLFSHVVNADEVHSINFTEAESRASYIVMNIKGNAYFSLGSTASIPADPALPSAATSNWRSPNTQAMPIVLKLPHLAEGESRIIKLIFDEAGSVSFSLWLS